MEVRDAVKAAKAYLSNILADENLQNVGLEEVEFDENKAIWKITLGFSRPWNKAQLLTHGMPDMVWSRDPVKRPSPERSYRVVHVRDEDGKILSIKLHDLIDG